jgi:hypothetical protein
VIENAGYAGKVEVALNSRPWKYKAWMPVLVESVCRPMLSAGTPAGGTVVVCTLSVVPAGRFAAGRTIEPLKPAAGGIATVCGLEDETLSGTAVAAVAGASDGTDAGAVGAAVGEVNGGADDEPPEHAASAAMAMRTEPNAKRFGRGRGMR